MTTQNTQLSVFGTYHTKGEGGHGSFVTNLFKTFYSASQGNREKLVKAFPEWFNDLDIELNY